jgi:hypothetical protein
MGALESVKVNIWLGLLPAWWDWAEHVGAYIWLCLVPVRLLDLECRDNAA